MHFSIDPTLKISVLLRVASQPCIKMHRFASLFEFFRPAPTTCRAIQQDATKRNIFELFTGVALDAAQPSRQRSRTPPVVGRRELLHKSCTASKRTTFSIFRHP